MKILCYSTLELATKKSDHTDSGGKPIDTLSQATTNAEEKTDSSAHNVMDKLSVAAKVCIKLKTSYHLY